MCYNYIVKIQFFRSDILVGAKRCGPRVERSTAPGVMEAIKEIRGVQCERHGNW